MWVLLVGFDVISYLTWYVSSAKQQASLGWNCQNHAGSVQRFVGESGCYLSEPCCGHHVACRLATWLIILLFLIRSSTDCTFRYWSYRYADIFYYFFIHRRILRIWKKCFLERGCQDSSWPYDDIQRCSAHLYDWFPFKAAGSCLGVEPDTPAAEGQAWIWRATCASLKTQAHDNPGAGDENSQGCRWRH